jgi:spore coat polysaccharide biosynthesis protein SpsF
VKTVAIIEARMTSTRLPGKIVRPILGRPLLELLIERLRRARRLDHIVVATTSNPSDDSVEELTRRVGVGCFRGREEDVLDRVLQAAHAAGADVIVEITGDSPLIDPAIVDLVLEVYQANRFDYVSNALKQTFPIGLDTQVFSTAVLEQVAHLTNDPTDHEHVALYIYEHPERFSLHNVESGLPDKYWNLRLTLDTLEDLALIRAIYEELYPKNPSFGLRDILELLERRPKLIDLNHHIQQKQVR